MNNYLLESLDSLSLQKEREKIIHSEGFDSATISLYDMEESILDNALEDLDTYSFLSEKKVIIIHKIEVLKQDDNKSQIDHLLKYLDNPNPNNLLIIDANKLNNTYKLTKELKKKCKYQLVEYDDKSFIKSQLSGYSIDTKAINLLCDYCLGDFSKITNECAKLREYKYDEKKITNKDIEDLVERKLGDSRDLTFAFTKSLAERNKKDALIKFRESLDYNLEPISLIGLLASQIRIIYQVKIFSKEHYSDKEIQEMLEEKTTYRIKKTRELIHYYTEKELLQLMQQLHDMDFKLKTSDVDGIHLIEMFILNL